MLLDGLGGGEDEGDGAVADTRGVASVDGTALLENGTQLGHRLDSGRGLGVLVDLELDNFAALYSKLIILNDL